MSLPGKILLHCWHQPIDRCRDSWREGGPLQRRKTARGRLAMAAAVPSLPPPPARSGPPVELHLLTGERFWFQTAFCLWTFSRHASCAVAPIIYDDGTLTTTHRAELTRLFPITRFVGQKGTLARLDHFLPAAKFPALRERWTHYPNLRKLIDPHLGQTGWKLVLDSDLLFFREPTFLLNWLAAPRQPLHGVDCASSYGYSRPLLNALAGDPLAERVNVGLTGLDSAAIDWEKLETWCATLLAREGPNYYLEQALVAMLVAGRPCAVAPAEDYLTLPRPPEAHTCGAVMHHYVAESKRWYFQRNWQRVLAP